MPPHSASAPAEYERLRDTQAWRTWGPYLSERQWGTVREQLEPTDDIWRGFPHEHARSRTYRWGEDGIAGISDNQLRLCFSVALWNEQDPYLKERLFGLANGEGNHGEDVKECYFYLDNVPTHSYMRMLYKYPQRAFPYTELIAVNRSRDARQVEYELIDTGTFDDNRYFDVFVEYAKVSPEDILVLLTIHNRSTESAPLQVLPHLWFRNTWWHNPTLSRPVLRPHMGSPYPTIAARHVDMGLYYLFCEDAEKLLFTDNETNARRIWGRPNSEPYVKDGINDFVVHGLTDAVDPEEFGTKSAALYTLRVPPLGSQQLRLRLCRASACSGVIQQGQVFSEFDHLFARRRSEAKAFYDAVIPAAAAADHRLIVRQAFSNLLWSKQAYIFDMKKWLTSQGDAGDFALRNADWGHICASDVVAVPDKWEYPWLVSWDSAFHAIAYAFIDPDFANDQLQMLLQERYAHPSGMLAAHEFNFGDVHPPVHAWAALFLYRLQHKRLGQRAFKNLKRAFHSLLLNFTWWVNRRDRTGRNVFQGGFLGVDRTGLFTSGVNSPGGGYVEHSEATGWIALFTQNMLEMAIELALRDSVYEDLAIKFYEHFVGISVAMDKLGGQQDGMWDEEDGFFYDVLRLPSGSGMRLKVRSLAGLLPLCASTVYPADALAKLPRFAKRVEALNYEWLPSSGHITHVDRPGVQGRYLLSAVDKPRLVRILRKVLDPAEFLSDYGLRSLSAAHQNHPFVVQTGAYDYEIAYRPAEEETQLFGGNSNWRGPIWFPINLLLMRSLLHLYSYYGDELRVECPTGSGDHMTLFEIAEFIGNRLANIFLRRLDGSRPVFGTATKYRDDPHWRDHLLFYEYFHGDNGSGLGASHHTGWTALIAPVLLLAERLTAEDAQSDLFRVLHARVPVGAEDS